MISACIKVHLPLKKYYNYHTGETHSSDSFNRLPMVLLKADATDLTHNNQSIINTFTNKFFFFQFSRQY